jgi:hypothetical protein
VTGSSSVVISNLAYLVGAVVLAVVLGFVVWYRHRPPRSVESNVESFHRGLRALAPDHRTVRPVGTTARPAPRGLRIQPPHADDADEEPETEPTERAAVAGAGPAPADEAPADEAPADEAPADEAPADAGPADDAATSEVEGANDGEPLALDDDDAPERPESDDRQDPAGPAAPLVNLTEQAHHQPAAGEAAGDWAGVETG